MLYSDNDSVVQVCRKADWVNLWVDGSYSNLISVPLSQRPLQGHQQTQAQVLLTHVSCCNSELTVSSDLPISMWRVWNNEMIEISQDCWSPAVYIYGTTDPLLQSFSIFQYSCCSLLPCCPQKHQPHQRKLLHSGKFLILNRTPLLLAQNYIYTLPLLMF